MASNSPFGGSSGISSLLKSSQARATKLQDLQDSEVDFQWQQSAKTYDDYLAYTNYLTGRLGTSPDESAHLGYTKKLTSAQSAYTSNEIQRQSIDVIEGSQNNTDKYNNLLGLFYDAYNNGHYDLAQSLHLQLDNLSVTIQNEAEAAANKAASSAKEASSANNALVDAQLQDNLDAIKNDVYATTKQYQELGPSLFAKRLKEYGVEGDFFGLLFNQANSLIDQYKQALEQTSDPSKQRAYQKAINGLVGQDENGNLVKPSTVADLPGVGSVTYQDLQDNAKAGSTGQALFVATAGGQFRRNQATGYAYGRDEQGNYGLVPIYGKAPVNETKPGQKDSVKYDKLLKDNNFQNVTENNGFLSVTNNGEFDSLGIERGAQVQLFVDRHGNLQVKNGDQAYSLQFDDKTGKYVRLNQDTANPISLLGDQLSAPFVSTIDQSKLNAGTIGVIDMKTSGVSRNMEPGTVLGQAAERRAQLQAESQARMLALQKVAAVPQFPTAQVQPANNFNVQAAPANTRLTLAPPPRLPNLSIAPTKPLPNVTVNNKPNNQNLTVNNQPNNQQIRF